MNHKKSEDLSRNLALAERELPSMQIGGVYVETGLSGPLSLHTSLVKGDG